MRRIRARRKVRFTLTLLLTAAFMLFFETRLESFAPQLKEFAASQIEERFDKNIKLSIGEIDGGIVRPIVLNDVRIEDGKGRVILPFLRITKIGSNYHLWDVFLKKMPRRSILGLLSVEPYIYVNFITVDGEISGSIKLKGDIGNARIRGFIDIAGVDKINFKGAIKDGKVSLDIHPASGDIKADGSLAEDGSALINLKVNHIKLGTFDLISDITIRHNFLKDASGPGRDSLEGELEAKNIILNYRPIPEFRTRYRIANGILNIDALEYGKEFKLTGRVFLREPFGVDITLTVDNANMNKILTDFGITKNEILTGIMSGKFEIKGPMARLKSDSRFEVRDGKLGVLDFESLTATLKGEGSVIRIEEARVKRESGYFALAGEIDLRRWGRESLFDDLKLASSEAAILWDGIDTSKTQDLKELKVQKKVTEDLNLGFKKFQSDNLINESARESDEVELEYKLQDKESFKVSVGQGSSFFGLEHKDKF